MDIKVDTEIIGTTLAKDKVKYTQEDGNEYADSLEDGYMDYGATYRHRVNAPITVAEKELLLTPVAGTFEFDNDRMYLTNVATQRAIDRASDVITSTVTVADTTTETTIYTASIPANALRAGNVQKFKACGLISTANASSTCTIRIKAGGVTIATIDNPGKTMTDECWEINACTTIRSIGSSGICATKIIMEAEGNTEKYCNGNVSIDTTVALDITVTAEWNSANVDNTISIGQGWMEYKN